MHHPDHLARGELFVRAFWLAAFSLTTLTLGLFASDAQAARYVARCVATPWCHITCTSNVTTVACYATIRPNGRCFKRCMRAR
jgi:hypothetical protein